MKRISGVTSVADLFGTGKNGYRDGDKAQGILGTVVLADALNNLQEEVASFIEAQGIVLDGNDKTQLAQAISRSIKGGDYKDSVRYTTTANIALTGLGTQAGGDWASALTAGDRVLAKDQTTGAEKGIYVAAAGAWTRATDADTGSEFNGGAIIPVEQGTTLADTNWQLTNDGTVTIGTTALTFAQVGKTSGRVLAQIVNYTTGAVATGSTTIPNDDTIPQNTEGDQYMSLAITPIAANSTLEIEVVIYGSESANNTDSWSAALFVDATANALACGSNSSYGATVSPGAVSFKYIVSAASTAARTYKVRAGCDFGGPFTFNGGSGSGRKFGGALASSITIKEYLA